MTSTLVVPTSASSPTTDSSAISSSVGSLFVYVTFGTLFGIVLTKAQVVSWFRIQEMFRFQSFHMFGVLGTAVLTATLSLQLIRRFGVRSLDGTPISVPAKTMGTGTRYWLGGSIFGLGWALVGACPGPLLAVLGSGVTVFLVPILSALAGTWLYGLLRPRLPH